MDLDPATRQRIDSLIGSHDVTLFMKGNRKAPQCGFSATLVRILDSLIADYRTVDVLSDPEIREGIKEYSSWPTIPQLYHKGEFMGGCDIVQELYSSGELQTALGVAPAEAPNPKVTVTEAAAEALKRTLQEMGGEGRELHLGIDARYQGSLFFAPRLPEELAVEASGFTLLMDPMTASRASGVGLDVVETPQGYSFRIDNPNAPEVPE